MNDVYYRSINLEKVINPYDDLPGTFKELVKKADSLPLGAPKMLTSAMLALAFEIERNKQNALAIMNPDNPEPIELFILAKNSLEE